MVSVAVTTALLALLATDCCTAATLGGPNTSNGKSLKIPLKKVKQGESGIKHRFNNLNGKPAEHTISDTFLSVDSKYKLPLLRDREKLQPELFVGEIKIGTPSQKFFVTIDTGSADLWVASARNKFGYCYGAFTCYNRSESETYKANGTRVNFSNEDKQMITLGVLSEDTVKIGDLEIKNQVFGEVFYNTQWGSRNEGILGLGFPHLSQYTTPPFFQAMEEKLFDKNVFSIYLKGRHPHIIFGGWDEEVMQADKINWVPITKKAYWQFKMDSVQVGPNATIVAQATANTGISDIIVPLEDMEAIAYFLGFDCESRYVIAPSCYIDPAKIPELPDIVIEINGVDYILKPSEYTTDYGFLLILGDPSTYIWHLGIRFLRKFYSIYNVDDGTLGLAPLK